MRKYQGFSLVELLCVVGIITVLLALFLPLVHKIQQQGSIIACRINLRKLGTGFTLYSYEYAGRFPHSDKDSGDGVNNCWFDVLDPFLGTTNLSSVKQCPQWEGYNSIGTTEDRHSLKMNGALCAQERLPETYENRGKGKWYWPALWSIRKKSRTVLLLDGRTDSPYDLHTDTRINRPYSDIENRHLDGANLLFVDGSSRYVNVVRENISAEKIGWQQSGNFIWSLAPSK